MQKYLFAELALERKGYRLLEVVAETKAKAEKSLPTRFGVAYLAATATRQSKPNVRTRIYRNRESWARLLDRYFLTVDQVDERLSAALV